MNRRVNELLIKPTPVTLSEAELDLEHDPVIEAKDPIPIRAWVRYSETSARTEGIAVAWTSRAVKIEWTSMEGAERTAWVWASAVDRIDTTPSPAAGE